MHFRDPIMYRIITSHPHHRTGYTWKVYPMYDFAHGQSDYFEGVTHSLCTLEFEVHRPLYDWYIDQIVESGEWRVESGNANSQLSTLNSQLSTYRPRQTEFNRLNITYTVMSKRKMLQLVQEGLVSGWDDPRMPTICGMRRRGYTSAAIKNFIDRIGYTKYDGTIDMALLEHSVREDLKPKSTRVCAILNPIKLIITNYPEGQNETLITENNPDDENAGTRDIAFGRELYIERDDFMENAPKDFFRLSEGREVRLKSAYIVKCTGCKKNAAGEVEEVYCEYDADTKSGTPGSNRKVKSTINWIEIDSALPAEVRLYDRLFSIEDPAGSDADFRDLLNPNSLKVLSGCRVEPVLAKAKALDNFQFLKIGYFAIDPDSTPDALILNQTVSLKDNTGKGKK
jgi:glutaminyl-tRNA synthetase